MITGNYPATASAIAQRIGLDVGSGGIISDPELTQMDDITLLERIRHTNIFARMVPQQKLRLANALKASHIGIAMGGRGTDVALEAAALAVLNDDVISIVQAIRLGRGIFDNMRKAMAYDELGIGSHPANCHTHLRLRHDNGCIRRNGPSPHLFNHCHRQSGINIHKPVLGTHCHNNVFVPSIHNLSQCRRWHLY
jgi:hypothetical protein